MEIDHKKFKSSSQHKKRPYPVLKIFGIALAGVFLLIIGFMFGVIAVDFSTNYQGVQSTNQNNHLPDNLDYESVEVIYDVLRNNFDGDLNEADLLDGLKKGLLDATNDSPTVYYNKEEAQIFNSDLLNQTEGIGAMLDLVDGEVLISGVLRGLPAEQAGLKTNDVITSIDGRIIKNMSLIDVVSLIRGERGTKVTLSVNRAAEEKNLEFTITRAVINIPSATFEIQDEIGILTISQFVSATEDDLTVEATDVLAKEAAQAFRKANVKGVVLDMRFNPGGTVDSTRSIGGLWIDNEKLITELGPVDGKREVYKAISSKPPLLKDIPLVILVNSSSASASEIVAAALRDYNIGTIVGETTYGKTSAQSIFDLEDKTILKITTAHWYRPSGNQVKGGIVPDIEISNDYETEVDEQLEKALQILQKNG